MITDNEISAASNFHAHTSHIGDDDSDEKLLPRGRGFGFVCKVRCIAGPALDARGDWQWDPYHTWRNQHTQLVTETNECAIRQNI